MCPGLTISFVTMNTPNFDNVVPLWITYNNRSQPPHDCSLTHWSLGDLDVIFKMHFEFYFQIGIFWFSSDSTFAWMSLGLIHDKSLLLQEWLGAIIQQAITPGITWANVDPDVCRHMVFLLSRMSYSQTRDPSLLTYLRPRQNDRHFADGMLKYIFLIEIDIAFD